jgi:hypothetical protein
MDTELKQYLDGMEARSVQLLTDIKESLERQMNHRFEEMNHRFEEVNRRFDAVDARFDTQANRLDRQAALIQTGSRWTNRMAAWAERVDRDLDKKGQQIEDLRRRNDKNNETGAK